MKALLLIPCYNEEKNIENILAHLFHIKETIKNKKDLQFEILIINDGSIDNTEAILEKSCYDSGCLVLHLAKNKGYGYVLKTGFKHALNNGFDWVISFDMDGQHEPKCVYKFIDKIMDPGTTSDIISGSRYLDPALFRENPWKDRFLVNSIITGILNSRGFALTDAFCGLKAHKVPEINGLDIIKNGYEMPIEMLVKAKDRGLKISEIAVPVIYKNRDEVLKDKPDSFLFQKAEERIERYVELINSLVRPPLRVRLADLMALFQDLFTTTSEVTAQNFKALQDTIFRNVHGLEAKD